MDERAVIWAGGLAGLFLVAVVIGQACAPPTQYDAWKTPHVYEMERATCYVYYGNNGTQAISCVPR